MITLVDLGGDPSRPLLVLGPSLGTSVGSLWTTCARLLGDRFHVVGWELPGHGQGAPASGSDVASLAGSVLQELGDGVPFHYAGDSVGGAVGLQLALDAPGRVLSATLCCTGAKIGAAGTWRERASLVRSEGTRALLDATPARWFGPALPPDHPARAALLADLAAADDESYAGVCEALAAFDVRDRLHEIRTPVTAVAGADDAAVPVDTVRAVADGVGGGVLAVLDGVGHLAPVEAPGPVAELIGNGLRAPGPHR